MNSNLLFDFTTNKEKNTLHIKREFAAKRQLVWDCFTKQELLGLWFAPAPFKNKTKSMDFREGGHWHYAMIDPNGTEFWAWTGFLKIEPINFYTCTDAFCDAEGNINNTLPTGIWKVNFTDNNEHTIVETIIEYKSLADLETIINMGMIDGMTAIYNQLDEIITNKKTN